MGEQGGVPLSERWMPCRVSVTDGILFLADCPRFVVASAFAQHVVTAHIRDTGPPPMLDPEFMLALATAAAGGAGDLARHAKSHMRRLEKEAGVVREEKVVVVRRKKRSPN